MLEGTFDIIGNTIKVLSAPEHTRADLHRLLSVLQYLRATQPPPEEVETVVQREASEFRSLWDVLPRKRTELYAFITMLVLVLTFILSHSLEGRSDQLSESDVRKITDEVVKQSSDQAERRQLRRR